MHFIISIHKGAIVAVSEIESYVSGYPGSSVFGEMEYLESAIHPRIFIADSRGIIGGAVIHEDNFQVGE